MGTVAVDGDGLGRSDCTGATEPLENAAWPSAAAVSRMVEQINASQSWEQLTKLHNPKQHEACEQDRATLRDRVLAEIAREDASQSS